MVKDHDVHSLSHTKWAERRILLGEKRVGSHRCHRLKVGCRDISLIIFPEKRILGFVG